MTSWDNSTMTLKGDAGFDELDLPHHDDCYWVPGGFFWRVEMTQYDEEIERKSLRSETLYGKSGNKRHK